MPIELTKQTLKDLDDLNGFMKWNISKGALVTFVGDITEAMPNVCLQDLEQSTIESIEHGYIANLSASGFLDCTDYVFGKTPEQAAKALIQLCGE